LSKNLSLTRHAQEFQGMKVEMNNAESRLNISCCHKTARAKEMAPLMHKITYWRVEAPVGMWAVRLSGNP